VSPRQNVEYKVVLVFPGFGDERDNAEQIVEEALHYLNTQKDEPGMRFAQNVTAQLEIVADADQAHARLQSEDDLATMILHDLDDEEKAALTAECAGKGIPVCHTQDAGRKPRKEPRSSRGKPREWKVVFKKGGGDEPRAHKILASTLTAPLEGDQEELMDRVGQLITVLALGVMEYHWTRNPPRHHAPE
jgi:hypothetical protein